MPLAIKRRFQDFRTLTESTILDILTVRMHKRLLLTIGTFLLVASPAYYLYASRGNQGATSALRVADRYIKASYARDVRKAYRWLSDQDRLAKDESSYSRICFAKRR